MCIISHSSESLYPAPDQQKASSTIARKRLRSMTSSSSSAAPNMLQVSSCEGLSSCEHGSIPTTAYGQYLKTGAYYLPDSYEEVPTDKHLGESTYVSSDSIRRQSKFALLNSKIHMKKSAHAWAKVHESTLFFKRLKSTSGIILKNLFCISTGYWLWLWRSSFCGEYDILYKHLLCNA